MKKIKSIFTNIVVSFNVVTVLVMLIVGYSDRINPVAHPSLSNIGLLLPVFIVLNIAFLVFWLLFKKSGALISFVGFLVCYAPIRSYAPLNISSEVPEDALKVMSYNVFCWSTWTDLNEPCEIVDYILQQDADIVCLQEAEVGGEKRVRIDSMLNKRYPYSKRKLVNKIDGPDELDIYSKLPIVGMENISGEEDTYKAVVYSVKTGERDTTLVIVTHFQITGLSFEDRSMFKSMIKGDVEDNEIRKKTTHRLWSVLSESSVKRAPQAEAVAEFIRRNKEKSIILMGDFNDSPISYTHRCLANELTDCYSATATGPGISYYYSGFYVRLDNIMCSEHWEPYNCKVDNTIKASDHYPIVCWLERKR